MLKHIINSEDKMESETRIYNSLAEVRKKKKMSQKELSARSGIIQADISRIENGIANPTMNVLKRLSEVLGVKLKIIFEEDTNMKLSNDEPAYSELYLKDAQKTIAHSFDYAVNKMNVPLEEYVKNFLAFKYLHLLEKGDPHYTSGISGIELAKEICKKQNIKYGRLQYNPGMEYWIGWIISYYQWLRNLKYSEIIEKFPLQNFIKAYPTFHEENKKRMIEYMDNVIIGNTE